MRNWMLMTAVVACLAVRPAMAQTATHFDDAGYGLLTVVTNLGYMPAKIVYAAVGSIVGGLAYVSTAGDLETANKVWAPALGGTYVITSAMLRGQAPVEFVGPRAGQERGSAGGEQEKLSEESLS